MQIKLKSLLVEAVETVSPDELTPEQNEQLNQMTVESGIRILSNKELDIVYLVDGNVAAGLWTSLVNDEFSFDTIVGKQYRNQALGARMIKDGLSLFKSLRFDDPNVTLRLDVVNYRLVEPLTKIGLKVLDRVGNHTIMGY